MKRKLQRMVKARGLNTNTVRMHWREKTSGTQDRYDESANTAAYADRWVDFSALVHWSRAIESGLRQFQEVQKGDVIVDVIDGTRGLIDDQDNTDVVLDFNREGLHFEIKGKKFTQKDVGGALSESWDVSMDDEGIIRTLLLTPMVGTPDA